MFKLLGRVTWSILKLVGRITWLTLKVIAPPLARRFQQRLIGTSPEGTRAR